MSVSPSGFLTESIVLGDERPLFRTFVLYNGIIAPFYVFVYFYIAHAQQCKCARQFSPFSSWLADVPLFQGKREGDQRIPQQPLTPNRKGLCQNGKITVLAQPFFFLFIFLRKT